VAGDEELVGVVVSRAQHAVRREARSLVAAGAEAPGIVAFIA
jgi:hypothetical protein